MYCIYIARNIWNKLRFLPFTHLLIISNALIWINFQQDTGWISPCPAVKHSPMLDCLVARSFRWLFSHLNEDMAIFPGNTSPKSEGAGQLFEVMCSLLSFRSYLPNQMQGNLKWLTQGPYPHDCYNVLYIGGLSE